MDENFTLATLANGNPTTPTEFFTILAESLGVQMPNIPDVYAPITAKRFIRDCMHNTKIILTNEIIFNIAYYICQHLSHKSNEDTVFAIFVHFNIYLHNTGDIVAAYEKIAMYVSGDLRLAFQEKARLKSLLKKDVRVNNNDLDPVNNNDLDLVFKGFLNRFNSLIY
jgi:hypothetical protein